MELDRLRVFHAVAAAGSLTQAGASLGITQSGVSRHISALEDDLQVTLFQRHARGLTLTEQGELLHRTTTEIFGRIEEVRTSLLESRERPSGELRVTATVGIATRWLMPRLHAFLEAYPQIALQVLIADRELDLTQREADIAIRMRAPVQADLIRKKLFTVGYGVYAAPGYLERHGAPETLADLDHHALVVYGETCPAELRDLNWLTEAGRRTGARRPALRVNNIHALMVAVTSGIGVGLLPNYYATGDAALVRVMQSVPTPAFDVHFVYAEGMRHSKRVAAFRDFCTRWARDWPEA